MRREIRERLRRLLYPMRTTLGRFALNESDSVVYKAATFIAADKIDGDYLEFGVYTGNSFISAFRAIEHAFRAASAPTIWNTDRDCLERHEIWQRMRFFAFDSFQGLPSPAGSDSLSQDFAQGKFSCSQADFSRNIARAGLPLDRVVTVPGWFEDILNDATIQKHTMKKAAIVYIDSDLYESARSALSFITPLLADGTVIVFDDWYNFKGNPRSGEQRACNEWLESHPEWTLTQYQKEGPWRNSFIANRNGTGT
jgi:O-methyltransferase